MSELDFWVIASKRVNEIVAIAHNNWLNNFSKKDYLHRDSD